MRLTAMRCERRRGMYSVRLKVTQTPRGTDSERRWAMHWERHWPRG